MTASTESIRPVRRLFIPLLLLCTGQAVAAMTAQEWLEAMSEAMRSLNYEGELIYQHGKGIEVLQLAHTVRDGRERERLTSLNGSPREIIRDQDSVRCILSDRRAVSIDQRGGGHGFPSLLPLSMQELSDAYRIGFGTDSRVAGRETRGIEILSRDGYRYGHHLYLDKEFRLPLKQVVVDDQGNRVGLIMYSRIKVDPAMPFETSTPSILSHDYALVEHAAKGKKNITRESPLRWNFGRLPPGFQVNHRAVRNGDDGKLLEHLVLSDGLASVSLYIEQAGQGGGLVGASKMGTVSAFGRRLDEHQIVVVGEVPQATVRFIAEAVEFAP